MCSVGEGEAEMIPVLIDENMETYLCDPCIQELKAECTVEILTEAM